MKTFIKYLKIFYEIEEKDKRRRKGKQGIKARTLGDHYRKPNIQLMKVLEREKKMEQNINEYCVFSDFHITNELEFPDQKNQLCASKCKWDNYLDLVHHHEIIQKKLYKTRTKNLDLKMFHEKKKTCHIQGNGNQNVII